MVRGSYNIINRNIIIQVYRTMPFVVDPKNPQHLQLYMKALGLQMPNVNVGNIDINQI